MGCYDINATLRKNVEDACEERNELIGWLEQKVNAISPSDWEVDSKPHCGVLSYCSSGLGGGYQIHVMRETNLSNGRIKVTICGNGMGSLVLIDDSVRDLVNNVVNSVMRYQDEVKCLTNKLAAYKEDIAGLSKIRNKLDE